MTQTVVLIGGAGYIGGALAELLLDEGYEVRLLDRFFFGQQLLGPLLDHPRLTLHREDTRYAPPALFAGAHAAIDLSGISNDPACDLNPTITRDVNLSGTLHVAKCAKAAGISRFLFSSSCGIYGQGAGQALTETSPQHPVSLYAETKIEAEKALAALCSDDFSTTYLRSATVYGLSHRMRFDLVVNAMTLTAHTSQEILIYGGGQQWRPLVHVHDVARAFLAALRAPRDKIHDEAFNVGSNEQNYQVQALASLICAQLPGTSIRTIDDDLDRRSYHVDFTKITNTLGFTPTRRVEDGVAELKQALEEGRTHDALNTRTVAYYKYLLDAEKVLAEVAYEGKVF